jgi:hypothetical protein
LPLKNRGSIGKSAIFVTMRISIALLFLFVSTGIFGQKFRFNSSIGASHFTWYEKQMTLDFAAEISFQHPDKNHRTFISLKTIGNIMSSSVDRSKYDFIEPPLTNGNQPLSPTEVLNSAYRGGEAEIGLQWNTSPKVKHTRWMPSLSIYSKSIGRKISSGRAEYIEEEKYSLHGLSAGLGLYIPGKTNVLIQAKIFEPFYREVTLYGRYIGVPFQSLISENKLNYKAKVDFTRGKFGIGFNLEVLNLGEVDNPKSKSISASQAIIPSTLLTYFF